MDIFSMSIFENPRDSCEKQGFLGGFTSYSSPGFFAEKSVRA